MQLSCDSFPAAQKKGELPDTPKTEERKKKAGTSVRLGDRTISLNCQRTEKPLGMLWEKPAGERPNYCCTLVKPRDGCPGRSRGHASRPEGLVPLLQELPCTYSCPRVGLGQAAESGNPPRGHPSDATPQHRVLRARGAPQQGSAEPSCCQHPRLPPARHAGANSPLQCASAD